MSVNRKGEAPIPAEQSWFRTGHWQKMEREAQADIEAGRVTCYLNVEDAIEALADASSPSDSIQAPFLTS